MKIEIIVAPQPATLASRVAPPPRQAAPAAAADATPRLVWPPLAHGRTSLLINCLEGLAEEPVAEDAEVLEDEENLVSPKCLRLPQTLMPRWRFVFIVDLTFTCAHRYSPSGLHCQPGRRRRAPCLDTTLDMFFFYHCLLIKLSLYATLNLSLLPYGSHPLVSPPHLSAMPF